MREGDYVTLKNNSNVTGWYFKKWLCETGRQPYPKDLRSDFDVLTYNNMMNRRTRRDNAKT